MFFLGQFCYVAKSDNDPQEDLARFAFKLNLTKQKALKHPSILLATLLEPCIEIGQNFLDFLFKLWLLKISKTTRFCHSLLNFEYSFFGYILPAKKRLAQIRPTHSPPSTLLPSSLPSFLASSPLPFSPRTSLLHLSFAVYNRFRRLYTLTNFLRIFEL